MASSVPTFKQFWQAYPLHKDRLRAEKAWNRLEDADKAAAIAALSAYTADCRQRGVAFQYAQGWLNGRRWEDEMEPEAPVQGSIPLPQKGNFLVRRADSKRVCYPEPGESRAQSNIPPGAPLPSRGGVGIGPNPEALTVNHSPSDSALADLETW